MIKHCARIAALVMTLATLPAVAGQVPFRPGVGPNDRRVAVDMREPPWNSLVRVQTDLGARCTGFLVAPRIVTTAAHCLYLPRVRRYIQPGSVHVLLAYRAGAYLAHARVARLVLPPAYHPADEAGTAGADRALLVLQSPLSPDVPILAVAPVPAGASLPVMLGGYGQDRDEVAVAGPPCAVTAQATDGQGRPLLVHDCQATRGTSGAPLLWRRPDGRWAAIGIQIEAATGAGGRAVPLVDPGPAIPPDRPGDR